MKKIEIEVKIEFNEYLKLLYSISYRRIPVLIATFFGLLMLIRPSLSFLGILGSREDNPIIPFLIGFFIVVILPLIIYFQAKRDSKNVRKKNQYVFSQEEVEVIGDTFNLNLSWKHISKIVELKNWILLYENKDVGYPLPKNSFSDEELKQFKELINSIPDLKKELKP